MGSADTPPSDAERRVERVLAVPDTLDGFPVPDRDEKGLRMLTRPAPLSSQCDPENPVGLGALLSILLAGVGRAFAAAFSRADPAATGLDELPGATSARAKRLMRSGD